MKITFFEAKDYDRIWFGEAAREYGFDVCYIKDKFDADTLAGLESCEVACMPERNGFLSGEIKLMKQKGVKGIIVLVNDERLGGKRGILRDIPVVTAPRFSPREAIQK